MLTGVPMTESLRLLAGSQVVIACASSTDGVFFVRRFVKEPPIFQAARQRTSAEGTKAQWLEISSPAMLRSTVLTSLLTSGAQGGYYVE
jgi:hypothetical protein